MIPFYKKLLASAVNCQSHQSASPWRCSLYSVARVIGLSVLLMIATNAYAVKTVVVQALFKDQAVLLLDGKRQRLKVGEQTDSGVKVIAIEGQAVVLDINGKHRRYKLGENAAISTTYTKPTAAEVTIAQNSSGLFTTAGQINGSNVHFLVDTGADVVAMNAQHARQLGVDFEANGQPAKVATASGVVRAYRVQLNSVAVGAIVLRRVEAVVLQGQHPTEILLGMSFLNHLEIQRSGGLMKLKKLW